MVSIDEKNFKSIYNGLKCFANKKGLSHESEDFASFAIERYLNGRAATFGQLFTDYLRAQYGDTRLPGGLLRSRINWGMQQITDVGIQPKSCDRGNSFPSGDNLSIRESCLRGSDKIDRACLILFYYWGFTEDEIGQCFGFSESRVSQRLKRISKNIRLFHKREAQLLDQKMSVPQKDVSKNAAFKKKRNGQSKEQREIPQNLQVGPDGSREKKTELAILLSYERCGMESGTVEEIPETVFSTFGVSSF